MVKTESESGTLLRYSLDPQRNRILTISDGTTNHYTGSSDNPAWATTAAGFTRYIHGIDGSLAATSTQTGSTDAVIDITNIQGSIVATAPDTTGSFHETTEYGLPRVVTTLASAMSGALNPYGWLGEKQRSNDSLAGLTLVGLRLYNPTTGRFLTTDPVPSGSPNTYTYPLDPINNMYFTGQWGCGWCHKVVHAVAKAASVTKHFVMTWIYSSVGGQVCFRSRGGPRIRLRRCRLRCGIVVYTGPSVGRATFGGQAWRPGMFSARGDGLFKMDFLNGLQETLWVDYL